MTNHEAHWLWYDFANIAGSAVMRSQNVDGHDPHIDWERQHQAIRIAGVSFACALLESLDLRGSSQHTEVLFHLRNASLHNSGNIRLNRGHPKPYDECRAYLDSEFWKEIYPNYPEREKSYFDIHSDGMVTIETSIFRFVERLFDSFLTDEERKTPPPKLR